MNPTFDHWMQIAGWTLVHFVWQGGVIVLATAVELRFLRPAAAQARYGVACVALAAMLVSPAITARVLSTSAQTEPATFERFVVVDHGGSVIPWSRAVAAPPLREGLASTDVWLGVNRWLPVIVATWLTGVALLLIRLAGGWWRVRRLHRTSLAAVASCWQIVGDQIAARLHLGRVVHIVDSLLVDTPTVVGWLRPVIILPIAAFANLTPAQVEAILAHELAHIRRHDYLVNLLQTMTETLLFYHPAVWWVSGRIRAEREHCCDAVAVHVCGDAVGYATALAELETARAGRRAPMGQAALALAATGGSLLDRVRRVLSVPVDDVRPARGETMPAVMTAALVLLFVMGAAGLRQQPALEARIGPEIDRTVPLLAPELKPNVFFRSRDGHAQVRETVIVRVQRQSTSVQAIAPMVSGTITDPAGEGIPDVSVVLTDVGNGPDHAVRTDPSGRFEFAGLPLGQYLIGVSAPGLDPFHDRLAVVPGEKMQLNIRLRIQTLAISTGAGRPAAVQGVGGRPPLPTGWTCVDDLRGGVGPGLCGPPSLVQELERDLKVQQEAYRKQGAKPAFMSTTAMVPVRYPQDLWDAMIEGSVVLEGRVGADGSPIGLQSVAPVHPGLAKAAMDTVSQWKFDPARLHDVAVEAPLKVTINFRLHN